MAAIALVLKTLIETKVDAEMGAISMPGVSYGGPLSQDDPSYFIAMCNAIAQGIASQTTITGVTEDAGFKGLPLIPGTGVSIGLDVNAPYLEEKIYTTVRDFTIADFGSAGHPPYVDAPPTNFLKAMCKGISEAVKEHYKIAWNISSTHPFIYSGVADVDEGNFVGLVAAGIKSTMQSAAPFTGAFWPRMCEAIALSYVDTIHNHTTNLIEILISGVCVVSTSPPQTCDIPGVGAGIATVT